MKQHRTEQQLVQVKSHIIYKAKYTKTDQITVDLERHHWTDPDQCVISQLQILPPTAFLWKKSLKNHAYYIQVKETKGVSVKFHNRGGL